MGSSNAREEYYKVVEADALEGRKTPSYMEWKAAKDKETISKEREKQKTEPVKQNNVHKFFQWLSGEEDKPQKVKGK